MRETCSVEIRVLTYNIRSLRDDRAALLRVVKACAPDVVCVQESPRFFGWRRAAGRLAQDLGLRVICGGANASGNLLLGGDRLLTEYWENIYLKHRRGLHLRGMATAVLEPEGGGPRITVASTHLSLDEDQRVDQAEEVLGHLHRVADGHQSSTAVLCGDFNSHPGSVEWNVLGGQLDDAWTVRPVGEEFTSEARNPRQRIDAVFVSPDAEVVRAGVPVDLASAEDMALASDHRPVLAVLDV
jgi:endonuclease/exonuclease/phosphatase family metal-dependent hydrolase